MGRKKATAEERARTVPVMITLLEKRKTSSEVAAILAATPGLFAYNRATVRGYHRDWKNGKLPEVKVLNVDELTAALDTPSDTARQRNSPTDDDTDLLRRVKRMIDQIEPVERPAGRLEKGQKRTELTTKMLSVRIPESLVDGIAALKPKRLTYHVEKALMLYLAAMNAED